MEGNRRRLVVSRLLNHPFQPRHCERPTKNEHYEIVIYPRKYEEYFASGGNCAADSGDIEHFVDNFRFAPKLAIIKLLKYK